ncbi:MAG: sodium-dependent bicarbonate transport family permease [Planctomycetota bacterium]
MDLLLSPPILFFLLGIIAALVRSDLEIPKPVVRLLSIYLLMSIGTYGGYKLSLGGLDGTALATIGAAMLASFAMPFVTYRVLRLKLNVADSAAVAATFGSISAVTFVTAVAFLDNQEVTYSGYMVAAMALMESPAIVSGVLLARLASSKVQVPSPQAERGESSLWREALFNGAVLVLVGSMLIGVLTGERGWTSIQPLMEEPFKGVLCIFLLDMGLVAARRLKDIRRVGVFLVLFGILAAVVQGLVGVGTAWLLGVNAGDALLLAILFGSASYIAVPAALRLALPEANPSIYVTIALAITFPFNIVLGIPMYYAIINAIGIAA